MTNGFQIPVPLMGTTMEYNSAGDKIAIVGTGVPLSDWTGIKTGTEIAYAPGQQRQIKDDLKSSEVRTKGLPNKFSENGNLKEFKRQLLEAIKGYGFFSITHLPDPVDKTKMLCIVDAHPRYTADSATKMCEDQVKLYDSYDKANDTEAKQFLTRSLDEDLALRLHQWSKTTDTFAVLFVRFVNLCHSTSIHRCESLKNGIRNRVPANFSGENIEQMALANREDARELIIAGQWDHNLNSSMLDNFLQAASQGGNVSTYHFELLGLSQRLRVALKDIGFMSSDDAGDYLERQGLTFEIICETAATSYRTLLDKEQWPAARNAVRDNRVPRANLAEEVAKAFVLIQQGDRSNETCFSCGKKGHRAAACPDKDKAGSGGKKPPGKQNRKHKGKPQRENKNQNQQSWKTVAPAPGASQTQTKNGKPFHWCAHCERWSTTHGTAGHTNEKTKKNLGAARPQANYLQFQFPQHEAWHASISTDSPWKIVMNWLMSRSLLQLIVVYVLGGSLGVTWESVMSQLVAIPSVIGSMVASVPPVVAPIFTAVSTAFGSYWVNYIAPILWLIVLVIALLPCSWKHRLIGSPPQEFRPFRMTKAKYKQYIRRCRRKRYSGRLRRKPRHTRHYGLATRHRRDTRADAIYDLIGHLLDFSDGLQFRRVRREGDNWRDLHRTKGPKSTWKKGRNGWRDSREQDPSSRFHSTYRDERQYDPKQTYYDFDGPPPGQPNWKFYDQDEAAASHRRKWCDHCDRWTKTHDTNEHFFHHSKADFSEQAEIHKGVRKVNRRRSSKPRVYKPTFGTGIPQSHLAILTSSASKAFFANGNIPAAVAGVVDCFRAALNLSDLESDSDKIKMCKIIWDSGCTTSISFCKDDFVGEIQEAPIGLKIQGIAKGLYVKGIGHVAWSVIDSNGMLRTIKVPAFYVPSSSVRLLSITGLLEAYPLETITVGSDYLELSGSKESEQRTSSVRVDFDEQTKLPTSLVYNHGFASDRLHEFNNVLGTTMETNLNLSPAERELLRWHDRLGHLNFKQIQFLLRTGVLAHSESARRIQAQAAKISTYPLCPACQFGKQRRRPAPGKKSSVVKDREGALKKDNLFPGQKVSVDHFVCSAKGRLIHTFGKEDPKKQYTGGCIFVDHASGYIFIEHQVHLNTQETLEAKKACENHFRDFGVVVSEYLSDNGSVFTSKQYTEHLLMFGQVNSFAGVGAHHHNGIAERSIQTIMSCARTMMMHQSMHWPEVASQNLWPLAVDHAVFLFNHMPNSATGLSPHDLLSRSRWPQSQLADVQVWGCPVYVLDKKMQDGKKLPKWKPRSTRQVYVGMSKKHASSVPLCMNTESGAITSQYHIVFDSTFSTVPTSVENLPDFDTDAWHKLFGDSSYQYVLDDPTDPLYPPEEEQAVDEPPPLIAEVRERTEINLPPQPLPVNPLPTKPEIKSTPPLQQREMPSIQRETLKSPPPAIEKPPSAPSVPPIPQPTPSQREKVTLPPPAPPTPKPTPPPPTPSVASKPRAPKPAPFTSPPRRSGRNANKPKVDYLGKHLGKAAVLDSGGCQSCTVNQASCFHTTTECECKDPSIQPQESGFFTYFARFFVAVNTEWQSINESLFNHVAFKAKSKQDPDTLGWNQAMNSPDSEKWVEAAKKEIEELEGKLTWKEVPMSMAKSKIIPGTWVFRVKRNPSGDITKYKARYCMRGDLEDIDEDEDLFAPTVAWSTIRLFLVLCLILGWTTASVDFSNAFVQAKLDKPKWMHLPRGFVSQQGTGTCLELNKSIYGGKSSPRRWSDCCIDGFKQLGFKQSEFDPCLLYRKGMMVVLYVDDAGIGAKDPADIDKLIDELRALGFELKKEGDFTSFLGIKMETLDDGSIELTQTGLIDKILESAGMTDCNPNRVPATGPLGSDPDGEPMDETWNYRSIVGMLLYLSTNTRPDITFAVSQVARFSSNPKQSHATAVKTILRYLKRTRTKGMIVKPTGKLNLDLFVDADFCGLYKAEPDTDQNSVKSRTGYVVKLSGCPLTWRSQLQTSITCSTLEAEYNALSSALRALLPLKRMLIEATSEVELEANIISTISARAFEDNQGAYYLANNQRITSRTRWYLNKWHWFWQFVNKTGVGPDKFAVDKVDTLLQDADYFTKALAPEPFEANRFRVQGW